MTQVFDPENGSVSLEDGIITFTPRADYFGNAGFRYVVTDARGAQTEGYAGIYLDPQNDLPFAVDDTGLFTPEDTPLDIDPATLLANDFDPDGDEISLVNVYYATEIDILGIETILTRGAPLERLDNGHFRYQPLANDFGEAKLIYEITDGSGFLTEAVVTIDLLPMPDDPVARDDSYSGSEDVPVVLLITDVMANDFDVDLEALAFEGVANLDSVSVEFDGAGRLIVTPDADFNGNAGFDYTIRDASGVTDTARVSIRFEAVNDAPVIGDFTLSGTEDTAFAATLDPALFTDVDGDVVTVAVRGAGDTPLPEWLDWDAATKTLSGTPPADFSGDVALEFTGYDGIATTVKPVTLSVAAVNDAPVAQNDSLNAGTATIITVPLADLLANDIDVDGDPLSVTSVAGGDGFEAALDGFGNLVINRDPRLGGQIAVDYTISDGQTSDSASLVVDLLVANRAPEITAFGPLTGTEDTALDLALPEGVVSDPDEDALTLSVTRAGGTALPSWLTFDATAQRLTGQPPADFNGTLALQLIADDGQLQTSRAFDLVIDPVNDAPVLAAPLSDRLATEDTAFAITLQQGIYSDVDGDTLQFDLTQADGSVLPDWISFDPASLTLAGTPPQDFYGDVGLRLNISDGQVTISDDFNLKVAGTPDAPVLLSELPDIDTDTTGAPLLTGSAFTVAAPIDFFEDPDGDPLAFAAGLSDGSALPDWLGFNGTAFSGLATRDQAGSYEIELRTTDGTFETSGVFTLTLAEGNAAPDARDDAFEVAVPNALRLDSSALLANDQDLDGDALTITEVSGAANGTVSLENGVVEYLADFEFAGEDQFTYSVTDGQETDTASVTVTVTNGFDDVDQGGSGTDFSFGGRGDDLFAGGAGRDFGFGGSGQDYLDGGSGNDLLNGGRGDDTILGGSGNDVIFGGSGRDVLSGGTGDDLLFGGRGSDTFMFSTGDGSDLVFGFEASRARRRSFIPGDELRLNVDGIDDYDDLMDAATQTWGGVLFDFGNGDEIFLAGTRLAALDEDKFTFY